MTVRHRLAPIVSGFVLLLCSVSSIARAQRDRYSPLVLQIPGGARQAAVGGAFVAVRDIESAFANPALAGTATGSAVSVERFGASAAGSLAASMSLGPVGAAVFAQYLDFTVAVLTGNFAPAFARSPPISSRVLNEDNGGAAADVAGGIALATVFRGYRWGAAVKYVEERAGFWRDASTAFDLGVAKEYATFTVGLSVQNIGPDIVYLSADQTTDLPLRASVGAAGFSRPVGPFDFAASFALSMLRDGYVAPAGGMEWSYSPLEGYNFVLRLGVRRPELEEQRPLAFGAMVSLDRFAIEYAFDDVRGGAGHRIGLRVR